MGPYDGIKRLELVPVGLLQQDTANLMNFVDLLK